MFRFIRAEQPGGKLGAKNAVGLELFSLCVNTHFGVLGVTYEKWGF
jgi:hypothetical protein